MKVELRALPWTSLELPAPALAAIAGARVPGIGVAGRADELGPPADRLDSDERSLLAETLEARLAEFEPPVAVLDSVRKLSRPESSLVLVDAAPGYLASPLAALWGALHAVRLARSLESAWERPVSPLLWVRADEREPSVAEARLVNEGLEVERLLLPGLDGELQPPARVPLDRGRDRVGSTGERLRQALGRHPRAGEAIDLLLPRPGETLAAAFERAFLHLLGHLGLIVLDPDWLREDCSRALARVVSGEPAAALLEGLGELAAAGFEPGIDLAEEELVLHHSEAGARPLRLGGEGFRYEGEPGSRTPAELAAEIVQAPGEWSAGDLLRPLVQELALPVSARIASWSQLARLATLGPLRSACGCGGAPVVPRFSATLIAPEVRGSLERTGLSLEDVLAARGGLVGPEAGAPGTHPTIARLAELAGSTQRELLELRRELAEIDGGLGASLRRASSQIREHLDKLHEKARRVLANRAGTGRRHLRRLQSDLHPGGRLQESALGPLPFLARFGPEMVDALLEVVPAVPGGHAAIDLASGEEA